MNQILREKYNEVLSTIPLGQRLPFIMEFHPEHLMAVNDWSFREVRHFIRQMEQFKC